MVKIGQEIVTESVTEIQNPTFLLGVSALLTYTTPVERSVMKAERKPGRPWRGKRTKHTVFFPADLTPSVKAEAKRRGKTLQDLIVEAVARDLGLPYDVQEELKLTA